MSAMHTGSLCDSSNASNCTSTRWKPFNSHGPSYLSTCRHTQAVRHGYSSKRSLSPLPASANEPRSQQLGANYQKAVSLGLAGSQILAAMLGMHMTCAQPSAAVLNSPNAQIPRTVDAALRRYWTWGHQMLCIQLMSLCCSRSPATWQAYRHTSMPTLQCFAVQCCREHIRASSGISVCSVSSVVAYRVDGPVRLDCVGITTAPMTP